MAAARSKHFESRHGECLFIRLSHEQPSIQETQSVQLSKSVQKLQLPQKLQPKHPNSPTKNAAARIRIAIINITSASVFLALENSFIIPSLTKLRSQANSLIIAKSVLFTTLSRKKRVLCQNELYPLDKKLSRDKIIVSILLTLG